MIGATLAARWRQASLLLAVAVLLPPLLVVPPYLRPGPPPLPPIRLPFGGEIEALVPLGSPTWALVLCLLDTLLVAALFVRRRQQPWRWRTTLRWNVPGWFAVMRVWADVLALVGIADPDQSWLVVVLLPILLAMIAVRCAAARVLGVPRVELAASPVVFAVPMRGVDWNLWFGRESLIVFPRRFETGQPGAALPWSRIAGVQPGRVRTPLARCAVDVGSELPYTAGEVLLVRGRGGQQWVVPVDSAREVSDLVVRAGRARHSPAGTGDPPQHRFSDPDHHALGLHQFRSGGGHRGPVAIVLGAVACAVLGGISLWKVVTGEYGPIALLGTLLFWSPFLLVGWFVFGSKRGPVARQPRTFSWQPIPGWEPLGPPCTIAGWTGSPPWSPPSTVSSPPQTPDLRPSPGPR